jgi:predicted Zn-dependent peptidase
MARKGRPLFRKTTFANGLTLISERHPKMRSLSIGIWVKTGTRYERAREAGISHFLEHMLFKGTETRTALQIAREVDQVGGEFNAFTAREYTCFHVLVLNRDIGLAVDILSDVLLNSAFEPGEMELERKVILQEIAMLEENPEELATDLFFEKAYGRHGLGRQILGYDASVRRMRRGDLLRYFRKHYEPSQLLISVSGDVSHESLVRRFRPLSKGRWPGRPGRAGSRKALGFEPAPKVRPGVWWIPRKTEQAHLVWGVETVRYTSKDRFAALLLNSYLGVGMSSLLFQEIREKHGLAYSVYSTHSASRDSGILYVYAGTAPSQVPVCLKLIEECAYSLCAKKLSEEELQSVKNNLKGSILLAADNVESKMSRIAKAEIFFGKYTDVEGVCEMIDEVTPQDVRRVARKIFGSGKRSILVLGPKPSRQAMARVRAVTR